MKRRTAVILAACIATFAAIGALVISNAPAIPQPRFKPAFGSWLPPSLDLMPAGAQAWTFDYPTDAKTLPVAPVNEPHIVLKLGHPTPIRSLRLAAEPGAVFKAWITTLDDNGKEELVLVGEAAGAEVEMAVPGTVAGRRVASVKLSYKPGQYRFATIAALDPAKIRPEIGKCHLADLPGLVGEADDNDHPARSTVVLLEDGKPLGPAHSQHEQIRKLAGGRYSHWAGAMMFSSSDGTDPRANGRKYTVARQVPGGEVRLQVN